MENNQIEGLIIQAIGIVFLGVSVAFHWAGFDGIGLMLMVSGFTGLIYGNVVFKK